MSVVTATVAMAIGQIFIRVVGVAEVLLEYF